MKEKLAHSFEKLKKKIEKAHHSLLVVHPNPDGDALGAAFALKKASFWKKNQAVDIFSVNIPNSNLDKLFPLKEIQTSYSISDYDTIFLIDRGDIYEKLKIKEKIALLEKKPTIINIDHHPHTFIPGAINVIDTQAAATCEIVYRFFNFLEIPIDQEIAQFILNGIYTDTGGFKHSNTSATVLEISSDLVRKGASISKINRSLFSGKSLNTLKLWAIALERAQINPRTGMVASFITKEDLEKYNATSEDIAGISDILNTISESKFSLVLSEREKNKIKASLRSDENKGIDVSKIARRFLGGGHRLASGFEIKGKLRKVGENWIIE